MLHCVGFLCTDNEKNQYMYSVYGRLYAYCTTEYNTDGCTARYSGVCLFSEFIDN